MSYRSSFVLPYRDRRVTGRHAKCSKFQRYPLCMANASMTLLVWTLVLWSVDASDASTGEFANDGTASVATDEASDSGDASGSDTDGTDTDGADTHGSGTGDDDSGGTTDEATTGFVTTGFVTSGATSSNDSSDSCGVDCSNVPPEFRDLEDGAIVRSPLTVEWNLGAVCECDDCGCHPAEITATLQVDGKPVSCGTDGCTIELEPGPHTLEVFTRGWLSEGGSDRVDIVVEGSSDDDTRGHDTDGGDPGATSDGSGCACSVDTRPSSAGFAWLMLLPVALRSRRRLRSSVRR